MLCKEVLGNPISVMKITVLVLGVPLPGGADPIVLRGTGQPG